GFAAVASRCLPRHVKDRPSRSNQFSLHGLPDAPPHTYRQHMVLDMQVRCPMLPKPAGQPFVIGVIEVLPEAFAKVLTFADIEHAASVNEQIQSGPNGDLTRIHVSNTQGYHSLRRDHPAKQLRAEP